MAVKNTGKQVDKETRFRVSLSTCLLVSIIAAYLAIGFQYALLTPAWQVPDEPAHYNHIRFIAEHGALPVLNVGDYDQAYLSQLTSQGFPPELSVDSVNYESWQPPLYYLLASPVFLAFEGALLPLRVFSLLLGAGVIVFAFLAVREASGNHKELPLLAAGFIAFIPQHVAMMAGVNNDSLSELLIAIGLWLILRANRRGPGLDDQVLGYVIGLAFVTKSQAYVLAPVAGLMLIFRWRRNQSLISNSPITNNKLLLTHLIATFLPALLIGSLMWWRNITVYGWPDFMAAIQHDQVVADQPRTSQWLAEFGATEVTRRFFQTTFQSFWGQFGWMGVVMDGRVYMVLLVYTVFLIGGLVISYWRNRELENSLISNPPISNYYLLLVSALLTLGLYLYYNLSYVQHQGRYLFPALIPVGLAAAAGLSGWGGILSRLTRRDMSWVVGAVALIAMATLDVFALYRFIVPALG
jgi:hypothetical protein